MLGLSAGFQAQTAISQGRYQQKVAENNALSARYAADDALARGAVEEGQARQRTRAMMGQQKAALAANGIDGATGTGSLLLTDTAGMGEFDALTVRNNAMKQAYGLNVQADNLIAQGKAARIAGTNAAIGTLLTSGSNMTAIAAQNRAPSFASSYNYSGDVTGSRFSASSADIRARR